MERRSVNSALIRQLNVARIFHAVRLRPGSSQRDLIAATGLDQATVSAVVAELDERGFLERIQRDGPSRPGRPEVALAISRSAGVLIGARLEPTEVRLIVTTLAGQILASRQAPGSLDAPEAVELLAAGALGLLEELDIEPESVRGMGVGVPALMSTGGRLEFAPNLHWRRVPVRELLSRRLPFPVYVDNDTKAGALAEKLFGACRDAQDFIFIAGHSGVGGGLYLADSLYRGSRGFAGEIGHLKVVPGGRICGCGGRGCLEAYLSESAILRACREAGAEVEDLTQVAGEASRGEPAVTAVLTQAGELLGAACATLVSLFDPEMIVLAGAISLVAEQLLPPAKEVLSRDAMETMREGVRLLTSPLGTESVPMGGVALALEGVLSLPSWLAASEVRYLG